MTDITGTVFDTFGTTCFSQKNKLDTRQFLRVCHVYDSFIKHLSKPRQGLLLLYFLASVYKYDILKENNYCQYQIDVRTALVHSILDDIIAA